MGFQQALSGLGASSKALEAIGNNVANTNTVGFKMSTVQFADAYAASLQGGGASQIGIGTQLAAVAQQFTQGNVSTTNNPLDLAINGGGMFRMDNNGVITYTRNGQFLLDKDGYLINSASLKVTGFSADALTGQIIPGDLGPIQINNTAIPPNPTATSQMQVNLDSRALPPASMTHGNMTGSAPPTYATPLVAGTGDQFSIALDGLPAVTITVPAGIYASSAQLASAMQSAINADPSLSAVGASVTVTLDSLGDLVVNSASVGTIGSQGMGSSVVLSAAGANTGFANFFGVPVATAATDNFDPAVTSSYTASTAQTVYDTLGNPHTFTLYYAKSSQPGKWQMYSSLDGGAALGPTQMLFNTSGVLISPAAGSVLTQSFALNNGALSPMVFDLDMTGTTQYGISFGTNQLLQDGYTSGKLSGMSVSHDGVVQGRYSNGKSRNMGQIVLATFNNPNALQAIGNNQWAETAAAGSPIPGAPGTGNLGLVQSGSVEESNVDMTAELVNMITQQRAYQANAQTIKTMDQIMQTLVNLR